CVGYLPSCLFPASLYLRQYPMPVIRPEVVPVQFRTTLTYRPSGHIGGNDNLVLTHSPRTRRSFRCRIWHRFNVSLRIPSYHSGPAREKREQRRLCEKRSCPNCNRHIVHRSIPNASRSESRPWARAQPEQRYSSKLPSGLHFHNRNLLRHSKLGKDSRPSKGKIVTLRLTTPRFSSNFLF